MTTKTKRKIIVAVLAGFFVAIIVDMVRGQTRRTTRTRTQTTQRQLPKAERSSDDTLAMIRRKGALDVGISTFVPWAMHDKNGDLVGFEVEVARKLAADLGVDLKLHPVGFSEIIPDLVNKRFDIIVTGIYPTPKRAIFVNFSDYYSESKIELVSSRQAMGKQTDRSDYNKPSVTIGVVEGAVYEGYASDSFPNASIKRYAEEEQLYADLIEGKISAAVVSTPGPQIVRKMHPDAVYSPFDALGRLGESFAIRRGDMDFLNYLNTWISFHEQTGWLKKERHKWFDEADWIDMLR